MYSEVTSVLYSPQNPFMLQSMESLSLSN